MQNWSRVELLIFPRKGWLFDAAGLDVSLSA